MYILYILYRATIMQHETSNAGKGNVEAVSVAIPAVMRTGVDGKNIQQIFSNYFTSQNQCLISFQKYLYLSERNFY